MTASPTRLAPLEIGLSAATWLEIALQAVADQNVPRAVSALAAIDARSWAAIAARFPNLPNLLIDPGVTNRHSTS